MKERIIIAKKTKRPLNAIQFNALAIVFLLGLMPFAVAIITNSGSSSDNEYEDSISFPNPAYPPWFTSWLDNGGDNYSSYYGDDMAFIENGRGDCYTVPNNNDCITLTPRSSLVGSTPMSSLEIEQTHYHNNNTAYVGSSGNGPFRLSLNSWFFSELTDKEESIDKFRFSFYDTNTNYNCGSSTFKNISWSASIEFIDNSSSLKFDNFDFEASNKIEYVSRDTQHGFIDVCQVGLIMEFDLTAFETLELDSFIQNWEWTRIEITMDDFQLTNGQINFGSTALPFSGTERFTLGVEHQPVNSAEAGFLIKTGTIVLSVLTFVLAIASTNYWDPFRNFVKGALD